MTKKDIIEVLENIQNKIEKIEDKTEQVCVNYQLHHSFQFINRIIIDHGCIIFYIFI